MNKRNKDLFNEKPIDLVYLISNLWKNKGSIIKLTFIFCLIGILLSISLKNNYTASSIFYPHYEESSSLSQNKNTLQSLAGLAGIDIGTETSNNIPPTLYPNIISSPQFKIEILDSKINFEDGKISFREYLLNKNQFNIKKILLYPFSIITSLIPKKNNEIKYENILKLSDEEYQLHEYLAEEIFLVLNDIEGFIELSVNDDDPLIASQVAKIANDILQKKIIDFKLKNINDTYQFINTQLKIAKNNFYNLQDSLAIFSDKNRNIKSDLFLNQYSRIESEYIISKNIYSELAINKEKTAIDVKKNTPIFTIIKPVVIPNEASSPNRIIIVIIFTFIGFSFASFYILLKDSLIDTWKKIDK